MLKENRTLKLLSFDRNDIDQKILPYLSDVDWLPLYFQKLQLSFRDSALNDSSVEEATVGNTETPLRLVLLPFTWPSRCGYRLEGGRRDAVVFNSIVILSAI